MQKNSGSGSSAIGRVRELNKVVIWKGYIDIIILLHANLFKGIKKIKKARMIYYGKEENLPEAKEKLLFTSTKMGPS